MWLLWIYLVFIIVMSILTSGVLRMIHLGMNVSDVCVLYKLYIVCKDSSVCLRLSVSSVHMVTHNNNNTYGLSLYA